MILDKKFIMNNDNFNSLIIRKIIFDCMSKTCLLLSFGDEKKAKKIERTINESFIRRLFMLQRTAYYKKFLSKFKKGEILDFNGIRLPYIKGEERGLWQVYQDVFKVLVEFNDNYDYSITDKLDDLLPEGCYCYTGKYGEDITIKRNDIVIDAGAWIGDFAAYAAYKGAIVYAFEPSEKNRQWLFKTASMNKGINIVPYGLGETEQNLKFQNSAGGSMFNEDGEDIVKIVSLDMWAHENKIDRIDFIKADIEGHERYMLLGAKKILKTMKPKLSLCTYHHEEDPILLAGIIKEINPGYNIIQKRNKLFAF